jgi:amidohydrolase
MSHAAKLIEAIATEAATLTRIRRELHAHPELSFQEHQTSERVAATLADWGIPMQRGLAVTGIIGILRKGRSDRAIGLRADMDALPMTERNTFPHASSHAGRMHACGHDGHTAMLLAAARGLLDLPYDGTVYLIFQPAEEGGNGGARALIGDGLFDKFPMEAIFGMHNWPGLPAGDFAVRSGAVFASSNEFNITIRGQGTHAAMPQGGVDPVPVACQMVQAFQTILTRNKRPTDAAVISVTTIQAGEAVNVIADSCLLRGTVRTFAVDVLDMIEQRMQQVANGTCAAFGASCEFQFARRYPPTVNHERETAFVRQVLRDFAGCHRVSEFEPTMGAEDFSFYLLQKPGCYFLIGNGNGEHRVAGHGPGSCTLHSPSYDFNDDMIAVGGSMWVRLVEAWFKDGLAQR